MHNAAVDAKQIFAAVALTLACGSSVPAAGEEVPTLTLRSGHSLVLHEPGLRRVAIGNGKIAGVVAIKNSDLILNGKSAGQTTLLVWNKFGRRAYEVDVSEQTLDDVSAMLTSAIADSNLRVTTVNHSIVVGGAVAQQSDKQRVEELISRFGADSRANKYTIVDAVTVSQPLGALQNKMTVSGGEIQVDRDAKGNLVVSGRVGDRAQAEAALERVRTMGAAYLGADGRVIDRLAVDTVSQVDIKVYVLEVDNTALQNLGLQIQSGVPDPGHPGFYSLQGPSFPLLESPLNLGRALTSGAFYRTTILAPTINLLVQNGHARILSSPDLVTMPGKKATFLVGGEIPIPYSTGLGQVSIVYKQYGVQLALTPTILGNGGIETQVAPEVSNLDYQNQVQYNGFTIPALKVDRLSTDVITQDGESIILGGLVSRVEQKTIQKVPILGSIPILGQLFRSTNYQRGNTDVVFVLTPQLITR
jgi:pilus assembly protein CpaC